MIHQDTTRPTFVEISRRLLEEWIDGEFEIERFEFDFRKGVGEGCCLTGGLSRDEG